MIQKRLMFLVNLPAFTFLFVNYIICEGVKAYFVNIWKEDNILALQIPFWKWSDWEKVTTQWRNLFK